MVIRRPARTNRRGVMLVDVLVGVVMLGSALAIMIGLSSRAMVAQRAGENLQIAAMLLDEKLALVLARGPDQYASRYGDMEGVCDAPFERFRYRLEIESGSAGQPYEVAATVVWFENGRDRAETVRTLIAPRLGDEPDPDRRPQEAADRLAGGAR